MANCIRSYLEQAKLFEQKEDRYVVHVDQTRDWPLGCFGGSARPFGKILFDRCFLPEDLKSLTFLNMGSFAPFLQGGDSTQLLCL